MIWWFVLHVVRGLLGLLILRSLPLTHNIIKAANIPNNERVDLEQIISYITDASLTALDHFTNMTRKGLLAYTVISTICFWLDLILLLFSLRKFSIGKDPYSDVPLLVISTGMFCADGMYMSWLISVNQRVSDNLSSSLTRALGGQFDTLVK